MSWHRLELRAASARGSSVTERLCTAERKPLGLQLLGGGE